MITRAADGTGLDARMGRLRALLCEYGSILIGYSGGVDSVFLAVVALQELGPERVLAVTGRSASYPEVQRRMALDIVERFGIPHLEVDTHEVEDPRYAANPSNRCYFCKTELWSVLGPLAAERGLAVVADGTNADDVGDHRPGSMAGSEAGVRSPLRDAGLSKADIRALSQRLGLPTWDAPASPCLSSRLQYGVAVTPERLRAVERAEEAVRDLGFREFRVRHHGDVARLEVAPTELDRAARMAHELGDAVSAAGFARVLLDVEGYRRGAMNEGQGLVQLGAAPARAHAEARVSVAGQANDIAAVAAPPERLRDVAARAEAIRSQGFRYVAIEIAARTGSSTD